MRQEYLQLYDTMLQEIGYCLEKAISENEKAETGFWIACDYWKKVKEVAKAFAFSDLNNEIDFFKNTKPRFTCYIEYFAIMNEALQFEPNDFVQRIIYWTRELDRYQRFYKKNQEFLEYYESGKTISDTIYFTRLKEKQPVFPRYLSYDANHLFTSPMDHLVRGLLAHRLYDEYARERLKGLVYASH